MTKFDSARMIELLQSARRPRIAVVGDYCLDKYLYRIVELDEPSVETGLTAWQIRDKRSFAGVAGTIAANLSALGVELFCLGLVGNDGEGFELLQALKKLDANTAGIVVSDEMFTNTYTKPMQKVGDQWVEMNRIDIRNSRNAPDAMVNKVIERLLAIAPVVDGIIVSDQFTFESGSVVNDSLREALAKIADDHPDLVILGDSRSHITAFRNMIVKCNAGEIVAAYRCEMESDAKQVAPNDEAIHNVDQLIHCGSWLAKRNNRPVIVTRGEKGAILINPTPEEPTVAVIETVKVELPIDICGAGDATNAGFVFGRTIGLSPEEAVFLANLVSSITIKQIGVTGTATREQLIDKLQ